jgi:hypothetical protein
MSFASLALVVVFPLPFTPTMETTVNPAGCFRKAPSLDERLFSTSRCAISKSRTPPRPWVS